MTLTLPRRRTSLNTTPRKKHCNLFTPMSAHAQKECPLFPKLPSNHVHWVKSTSDVASQSSRIISLAEHKPKILSIPCKRSKSIPISNKKSESQEELAEEEAQADVRDYVFFCRIVDRILTQQEASRRADLKVENDRCLARIIGTRQNRESKRLQTSEMHRILEQSVALAEANTNSLEDEGMFVLDL